MPSRTERSLFADWWWTVDRLSLACLFALMIAGLVLLMGGGPPVAERLGLSPFHFVHRRTRADAGRALPLNVQCGPAVVALEPRGPLLPLPVHERRKRRHRS